MAGVHCGRPLAAVAHWCCGAPGAALRRGKGRACCLRVGKGQNEREATAEGRDDSVRARAKRALWARPAHAREVFGKMPTLARKLQTT